MKVLKQNLGLDNHRSLTLEEMRTICDALFVCGFIPRSEYYPLIYQIHILKKMGRKEIFRPMMRIAKVSQRTEFVTA